MSLKQQLSWLTGITVLLMLVGNLSLTLVQAKQHFEQLLNARAYDAATALALSLTQQVDAQPAQQQRIIDVLFDRGFFSEIKLLRSDKKQVLRRAEADANQHTPNWFKELFALEVLPAKTNVSRGWQQLGELTVKSHTQLAYNDLWGMFTNELKWFLLVLLISVTSVQVILNILLKPLMRAEQQALSISEKNWVKQNIIPSTREFKRLTLVMNQMVDKLQSIFNSQTQTSDLLRQQSLEDGTTGLLNHRGFDQQMTHILEGGDEHSGFLLLLHLEHFAQYNQQHGRALGDQLLVQIANHLKAHFQRSPAVLIARHRGADFALYIPCVDKAHAKDSLQQLKLHLNNLEPLIKPTELLMGSVFLQDQRDSLNNALSQADFALRQAQKNDLDDCFHEQTTEQTTLNASQWRSNLLDIIENGSLHIEYLPVLDMQKQTAVQFEVLSRIHLQGEHLSGARFWPMVEFHKLSPQFDLQVLKCLAHDFPRLPQALRYCVNLAHLSVASPEFQNQLDEFLHSQPLLAASLAIEVSEHVINEHEAAFAQLIERLSPIGVQFGVDKFGTGKQSFAYLQRLRLDYLRIDGGLNRGLHQAQDYQFYIQSMVHIAHSLDIKILAEGLEDEKDIDILKQAGIDSVSGFFFSKSLPIEEASRITKI